MRRVFPHLRSAWSNACRATRNSRANALLFCTSPSTFSCSRASADRRCLRGAARVVRHQRRHRRSDAATVVEPAESGGGGGGALTPAPPEVPRPPPPAREPLASRLACPAPALPREPPPVSMSAQHTARGTAQSSAEGPILEPMWPPTSARASALRVSPFKLSTPNSRVACFSPLPVTRTYRTDSRPASAPPISYRQRASHLSVKGGQGRTRQWGQVLPAD